MSDFIYLTFDYLGYSEMIFISRVGKKVLSEAVNAVKIVF